MLMNLFALSAIQKREQSSIVFPVNNCKFVSSQCIYLVMQCTVISSNQLKLYLYT